MFHFHFHGTHLWLCKFIYQDILSPRFFILESAEIFALLGYCVYLQIIELKCCSLNRNLDKNIIDRGRRESAYIESDIIDIDKMDDVTDDEEQTKSIGRNTLN